MGKGDQGLERLHTFEKPPWHDVVEFMSENYALGYEGVFQRNGKKDYVCDPCWVTASTRTGESTAWGVVVSFIDQDGREREYVCSSDRFHESKQSIAQELSSLGLRIMPGKEGELRKYLRGFVLPEAYRRRCVDRTGWVNVETPLYVLPNQVIGLDQKEPVIFQPEAHSPVVLTMHKKGSLDQWHAFVVRPCIGNPYLLFSLCASYASPLLKHLRMDCGGFHFYGASSRGKTTLLQVAASSWGCGIDPASGDNSFVGRWNSTGNAFEATASAHNDGILLLDEMGTCSASNFGALIYGLFGGEGKKRLNKQSGLRSTRSCAFHGRVIYQPKN